MIEPTYRELQYVINKILSGAEAVQITAGACNSKEYLDGIQLGFYEVADTIKNQIEVAAEVYEFDSSIFGLDFDLLNAMFTEIPQRIIPETESGAEMLPPEMVSYIFRLIMERGQSAKAEAEEETGSDFARGRYAAYAEAMESIEDYIN